LRAVVVFRRDVRLPAGALLRAEDVFFAAVRLRGDVVLPAVVLFRVADAFRVAVRLRGVAFFVAVDFFRGVDFFVPAVLFGVDVDRDVDVRVEVLRGVVRFRGGVLLRDVVFFAGDLLRGDADFTAEVVAAPSSAEPAPASLPLPDSDDSDDSGRRDDRFRALGRRPRDDRSSSRL